MRHDAWLVLDTGQRCKCVLSNVSSRGACINVHDSEAIPDNFMLLLAANSSAWRRCRVIWRKPRQLGVKFDTWLDERVRALKKSDAGTDVAPKETEAAESSA
jgi:PilZ domain